MLKKESLLNNLNVLNEVDLNEINLEDSHSKKYTPITINAGSFFKCKTFKNTTLLTVQNPSKFNNAHFYIEPDNKGKSLYNIPPGGLIAYTWDGNEMKIENISFIDNSDIQVRMIDLE